MATAKGAPAPLEDLMLAMDVVDTLRHRSELIDRELDSEARRERMLDQLRQIYRAQGIEVSDAVLAEGVRALEEERFGYTPPEPSLQTRLARLYVNRARWAPPLLLVLGLLLAFFLGRYLIYDLPRAREHAALGPALDDNFGAIVQVAETPLASEHAQGLMDDARAAIRENDYARAKQRLKELKALRTTLESVFDLRIVSRPNELSGVWRVPAVNENARNYYLIVEAIDASGKRLPYWVESEETGQREQVLTWGVRVDQATFETVAADKGDDGIIQRDIIGHKDRGKLLPDYTIPTTGATITDW